MKHTTVDPADQRPSTPAKSPPRFVLSDRLWEENSLTTHERAVGEVIARHMDVNGSAYPGYRRLATLAGCSTRCVQEASRVLCDGDPSRGILPLLTREKRIGKNGKPRGYLYRLVRDPSSLVKARLNSLIKTIPTSLDGRPGRSHTDKSAEAEYERLNCKRVEIDGKCALGEITGQQRENLLAPIRKRLDALRPRAQGHIERLGGRD